MPYSLSTKSKENRKGIDSRLIEISDLAITLTLVDFGHGNTSGLRLAQVQHKLFLDGKSKADGYDKLSKHQSGKALDFYAYVNGGASWKRNHLAMVGAVFLQSASMLGYKVSWGGLWSSKSHNIYGWDMAHIELIES